MGLGSSIFQEYDVTLPQVVFENNIIVANFDRDAEVGNWRLEMRHQEIKFIEDNVQFVVFMMSLFYEWNLWLWQMSQ